MIRNETSSYRVVFLETIGQVNLHTFRKTLFENMNFFQTSVKYVILRKLQQLKILLQVWSTPSKETVLAVRTEEKNLRITRKVRNFGSFVAIILVKVSSIFMG